MLNNADGRAKGVRRVDASVFRTDAQAMESSDDGCIGTGAQRDQAFHTPILRVELISKSVTCSINPREIAKERIQMTGSKEDTSIPDDQIEVL